MSTIYKRPKNIIIFNAESWDGRMMGSMGHPALAEATPNIDAFAKSGVLFENAYCSHPICCPSRANMWSGKYTHNIECWNNFKGLEPDMWVFPEAVEKTHDVGYFGKRDYRSGGHTLLARISAWLGPVNNCKPVFDSDPCQNVTISEGENPRFHDDWEMVDKAKEYLIQHTKNPGEKRPFFLTMNTHLVHAAFCTNQYWLNKIPDDLVDIPPDDPTEHGAISYQRKTKAWKSGFGDGTVKQARRVYLAMCAEADAIFGELLETVKILGLENETIIIFTSDHGELALEHQDWYKMSMYEGSLRVPLIVSGPGIQEGKRLENIVSLVDLCPTLLDISEMDHPYKMDGESLLPLLQGRTSESRNSAYAMFSGCTLNTTAFMIRLGPWKYISYTGYDSLLFNIEDDPGELQDRAEMEPDICRKMEQYLDSMMDRKVIHKRWITYNKHSFAEFQRQAKQGLYIDNTYGLIHNPSSDYMKIMNNCFTGWNEEDEKRVEQWLEDIYISELRF